MRTTKAVLLGLAPALAAAVDSPSYDGFTRIWQENFSGSSGALPNEDTWNIIDRDIGVNNELQTYRRNNKNLQLSGGGSLQLIPYRDSSVSGGWTSGRIESKYTFTPADSKVTRVEAQIRFGSNDQSVKQGIWPAFWMMGDSLRHGTAWPGNGELDILETVNGILTGYGTTHCDVYPGGVCNEGTGIQGSIAIPNQDWHVWRLEIDRTPSNWQDQVITWYMDGTNFHHITGSTIGKEDVWTTLARSPLYFLLNVAVGGSWPGNPNNQTQEGFGQMMEVNYVAQYQSN